MDNQELNNLLDKVYSDIEFFEVDKQALINKQLEKIKYALQTKARAGTLPAGVMRRRMEDWSQNQLRLAQDSITQLLSQRWRFHIG